MLRKIREIKSVTENVTEKYTANSLALIPAVFFISIFENMPHYLSNKPKIRKIVR